MSAIGARSSAFDPNFGADTPESGILTRCTCNGDAPPYPFSEDIKHPDTRPGWLTDPPLAYVRTHDPNKGWPD